MATAETTVNFGDLKDDKQIQEKIITLRKSVEKIENMLDVIASNPDLKEKLTLKEKVDYDLFMAYTLNTLFWMYMRMKGEDPNKNEVKNQLNRVKDYMIKAKQVSTLDCVYSLEIILSISGTRKEYDKANNQERRSRTVY